MTDLTDDYPSVHLADMPVLRPVPIRTRGLPWYVAYWRWLTVRRDFVLADDWRCRLPTGECVVIRKGFVFDGASVPRLLWAALSPIGLLLIPGLLHDAAYTHAALYDADGHAAVTFASRREADALFNEVNQIVNQMHLLTALCALLLWAFAWHAWRRHRRRAEVREGGQ